MDKFSLIKIVIFHIEFANLQICEYYVQPLSSSDENDNHMILAHGHGVSSNVGEEAQDTDGWGMRGRSLDDFGDSLTKWTWAKPWTSFWTE